MAILSKGALSLTLAIATSAISSVAVSVDDLMPNVAQAQNRKEKDKPTTVLVDAHNNNNNNIAGQTSTDSLALQKHLRAGEGGMVEHVRRLQVQEDTETEATSTGGVNQRGHGRRLQGVSTQEIPYGIIMVQGDQVPPPPATNIMKSCIVDTGYDSNHPDLRSDQGSSGLNGFASIGFWYTDEIGNGTHVAGTVAAIDNAEGVVGVYGDPTEYSLFISKVSGFSEASIGASLIACKDAGAKVIAMSTGGFNFTGIENVLKDLYDNDILIFAGAGDSGDTASFYPASFKTVVSVAAVDQSENVANFSQRNDQVEISAPGVDIYSTLPGNNYGFKSGTSMASAHVAGSAARIWSSFTQCTNNQIRNTLLRTASVSGQQSSWTTTQGWGVLQAKSAFDQLETYGCDYGGPTDPPQGQELSDLALGGRDQLGWLTHAPTPAPTINSADPTDVPTDSPTVPPTNSPTDVPTDPPTVPPTNSPTDGPPVSVSQPVKITVSLDGTDGCSLSSLVLDDMIQSFKNQVEAVACADPSGGQISGCSVEVQVPSCIEDSSGLVEEDDGVGNSLKLQEVGIELVFEAEIRIGWTCSALDCSNAQTVGTQLSNDATLRLNTSLQDGSFLSELNNNLPPELQGTLTSASATFADPIIIITPRSKSGKSTRAPKSGKTGTLQMQQMKSGGPDASVSPIISAAPTLISFLAFGALF